ncbi:hypothetical protein FD755_001181 [Muntiacus reevesi]|uniref:Uncharacterized protein n=1 Tax=Muntiacus reevesi TaxID=9886 RepID=A0A5J5N0Y8_MUNRE|nr:hypothetical protein FD755_001181 [Muntiacus reevesi]
MQKSLQSDLAFFRFPLDPARSNQLNKHYRPCAKDFETSMIFRTSPYGTVLRDNAIPIVFDLASHLNNPHNEIETLKQKQTMLKIPLQKEGVKSRMKILTLKEKENKEYLKSLSKILILMGKQNIPLDGHEADEIPEGLFTPDNFQALLECWISSGEEVLRKRFETTAMLEICESCIQEETLREVRDSHFFSIITDDVVDIAGEEHLPVLVRFVDEAHNLRDEFVGFLPYEANAEILAMKFHTIITEKWGLNTEYCCGQAYFVSSYTLSSSCALNMWLAKAVPVMGASVSLGTIEEVCSFFHQSPQLLLELESVVFVLFQNNEERGKELKGICRSQWTGRHDAFEILVDLLQALVLCLDGINSDTTVRWNNCIAGQAFVLCSVVTDFNCMVTIVGQTSDVFFAASSLTAVLHSLNEMMENIEVCHEFWFEEATDVTTKPAQHSNLESQLISESYYKETLSVPPVEHIIQELKDIFSEQHHKALKCLSLVPSLHCWGIKWKHRRKDIELPSTIYEALHLPDIVLCILPVMKVENERYENGQKHLKAYLRNTLTYQRSSYLALLNINFDIKHDLDFMVDTYIKLYISKSELPTDNSETIENT